MVLENIDAFLRNPIVIILEISIVVIVLGLLYYKSKKLKPKYETEKRIKASMAHDYIKYAVNDYYNLLKYEKSLDESTQTKHIFKIEGDEVKVETEKIAPYKLIQSVEYYAKHLFLDLKGLNNIFNQYNKTMKEFNLTESSEEFQKLEVILNEAKEKIRPIFISHPKLFENMPDLVNAFEKEAADYIGR